MENKNVKEIIEEIIEKIRQNKEYFIIGIVVALAFLFSIWATSSDNSHSDSSDVCGICGGSGVVTNKVLGNGTGIQKGFDTYYRCRGCNGTGKA